MDNLNGTRLVSVQSLSPAQERELSTLRELCRSHEPVELPLFASSLTSECPALTMFLAYSGDVLIGFASLPIGDTPELVGAVHPDYRRRSVGRQLLEAARIEVRRRECEGLIVVCEVASPAGISFAQAVGGAFECAEFQLELERCELPPPCADLGPWEVVEGRRDDAPLLAEIGSEAFGDGKSPSAERVARGFDNPRQRFCIAKSGGVAVGALRVLRDPGAPIAYIYSFGIRRAYQRLGFGRRLLRRVADQLFDEGCEAVRLEVDTTNAPALALYRSSGFRQVAEYRYYRLPA